MVSSVQAKVSRLEAATGGGGDDGECPDCGWGGGDDGNHRYEVTWVDPGGPEDREEYCESCGQQLVIVLTWGDDAP